MPSLLLYNMSWAAYWVSAARLGLAIWHRILY